MMKIVTIIGARPQFVKAAVISRLIRNSYSKEIEEYIIHTGQHFDENMSEVFFKEMQIPEPAVNLNINSSSHGAMTGRMLEEIEKEMQEQKPDLVLVYGDTNSTLAGALAAGKMHIPVAHVEAGLRSFNREMPEEINRVLTDHISEFLFCPTSTAIENLNLEGITKGVYQTGDIMLDASLFYRNQYHASEITVPDDFFLLTLHRQENTDSYDRLSSIVHALNDYDGLPGVFPMHPRTAKQMKKFNLQFAEHITVIEPVGYMDMIQLENASRFIVTDSGGVQKEAYFFNKPCITLRDQTEWVETVEIGANVLVGADPSQIMDALLNPPFPQVWHDLYGKGKAGDTIVDKLLHFDKQ